jgi:hypothetical protein
MTCPSSCGLAQVRRERIVSPRAKRSRATRPLLDPPEADGSEWAAAPLSRCGGAALSGRPLLNSRGSESMSTPLRSWL